MHPFTGLATREDGAIKICCRSLPIGNIKNESLEFAWNSEKMREVRRQVLNGERPDVCAPCFDLEDQGVQSLRQRHIADNIPESRVNLYPNALDSLSKDMTMPFELPTMEIKINNLCNLKCRMCNPLDSTQWKDWNSIVEHYKKEDNYLVKAVEDLVDLCEAVCDAVGIDEAFDRANTTSKLGGPYNFAPANKKDYLKPSPEQLKTALAKQADNSPILQTGQGTNTKTVRPSDVQAKKRAKRKTRQQDQSKEKRRKTCKRST